MSNSNEVETDGIGLVMVLAPNLTDKPAAMAAATSVGLAFGGFAGADSASCGPHLFFFPFIAAIIGYRKQSALR